MRWKRRGREAGSVGGHQHGARRHVDKLADARRAIRVARGGTELDQVGAEGRRAQQEEGVVSLNAPSTPAFSTPLPAPSAPPKIMPSLAAWLTSSRLKPCCRPVTIFKGLGHGQVDGDRLDTAEGRRDQGARRYRLLGGGRRCPWWRRTR